ncbi:hypothetical protein ACFQNE_14055, partial [Gordonia phosphorivorans]
AVGDLSGARVMFEESLALRRQLRQAQPGAVGPVQDLASSLQIVGDLLEVAGDSSALELRMEERQLRDSVFGVLRDYQSALAWVRCDLAIDRLLREYLGGERGESMPSWYGDLLKELQSLLVGLDKARPLEDDLRDELQRVRRALAQM